MGASPLSRPGRNNGAGDENANFWELFGETVLMFFHRMTIMMPLHRTRTIMSGKSVSFPTTGTATASKHVAGESIFGTDNGQTSTYLSNIANKLVTILVDDPTIGGTSTPEIDDLKNNWDQAQVYAYEVAKALVLEADQDVLSTIFAAAQADPTAVGSSSFSAMTGAEKTIDITDASNGQNIANGIFAAQLLFDNYNIPEDDRHVVLRPKQYRALAGVQDLVNKDFTSGEGDTTKREILRVGGFQVHKTTAFGSTDESAVAEPGVYNNPWGTGNGYNCDWTDCAGVAFTKDAAATVKMKDLTMETWWEPERQLDVILGKYIMGHGILRPECALSFSAGGLGTGIL